MTSASDAWNGVLAKRHGDKLRPAPTADTSETEITTRVRTEEAQRAADIAAACDLAGAPGRAAGFIADRGKTVGQVLAVLSAERAAEERKLSRSRR